MCYNRYMNTSETFTPVLTQRAYRALVRKITPQIHLAILAGKFDEVRALRAELDAINFYR